MNRFKQQLEKITNQRSRKNMNKENYPYSLVGVKSFESKDFVANQDEINPDYFKLSLYLKKLNNYD